VYDFLIQLLGVAEMKEHALAKYRADFPNLGHV